MKYYSLTYSDDTNIIGKNYPQVESMNDGYNSMAEKSILQINDISKIFPDKDIDLNSFVLYSYAKVTDFVSSFLLNTTRGFLISDKAKKIFESKELPLCKFYHATLIHKKKLVPNYFWFHISPIVTGHLHIKNFVDFNNSLCYIGNSIGEKIEDISINNLEEFEYFKQNLLDNHKNKYLNFEKITFKGLPKIYDLLTLQISNYKFYISEKLLEEMNHYNITGFDVYETDRILVI